MLNQQEIRDLSQEQFPSDSWGASIFGSGYNVCNETIPSECIGFAEWIQENGYGSYYVNGKAQMWEDINREPICKTTEELYSIYLESLNNDKKTKTNNI
jgi:hypothetical protein